MLGPLKMFEAMIQDQRAQIAMKHLDSFANEFADIIGALDGYTGRSECQGVISGKATRRLGIKVVRTAASVAFEMMMNK